MFTLYLYNYSSQEKISEWQKWGASKPNSVLQHYLTQMCKTRFLPRSSYLPSDKVKKRQKYKHVSEILLLESHYVQPYTGARKKTRQKNQAGIHF